MGHVKFNADELDGSAGRITAAAAEMKISIDRAKAEVDAMAGQWEGGASNSFQAMYLEFNSSAASIQSSLESIANTLKASAQVYRETEARVQQSVSGS